MPAAANFARTPSSAGGPRAALGGAYQSGRSANALAHAKWISRASSSLAQIQRARALLAPRDPAVVSSSARRRGAAGGISVTAQAVASGRPAEGEAPLKPGSRLALQLDSTRAELKAFLLEACAGGFSINASDRNTANELLLKLESINPTKAPAYSPALNGCWQVLHAPGITKDASWLFFPLELPMQLLLQQGAFSPAQFSLEAVKAVPAGLAKVERFFLRITPEQPRVEAHVVLKVLGREFAVKLRNLVDQQSDTRFTEKYQEAVVMGRTLPIPGPLRHERAVVVSYVDADLLVCRDVMGQPYVMVRVDDDNEGGGGGGGGGGWPSAAALRRASLEKSISSYNNEIRSSEDALSRAGKARLQEARATGAQEALKRADESYARAQTRLAKVQKSLSSGRRASKAAASKVSEARGGTPIASLSEEAPARARSFLKNVFPQAYGEDGGAPAAREQGGEDAPAPPAQRVVGFKKDPAAKGRALVHTLSPPAGAGAGAGADAGADAGVERAASEEVSPGGQEQGGSPSARAES